MAKRLDFNLLVAGLKGAILLEKLPTELKPAEIYYYHVNGEDSSVQERLLSAVGLHGKLIDPLQKFVWSSGPLLFAVGWQYLLKGCKNLIVLHDSVLPKYRGFSPTVSALINGDPVLGVTALRAAEEADSGEILFQSSIDIIYPKKVEIAFQELAACYVECIHEVISSFEGGALIGVPQQEAAATYSIWRDKQDFQIQWDWSSEKVQRFVDAVGFPYQGAETILSGRKVIVQSAEIIPDLNFENRVPGKVWKVHGNGAIDVLCGEGMIRLTNITEEDGSPITLTKIRLRFGH